MGTYGGTWEARTPSDPHGGRNLRGNGASQEECGETKRNRAGEDGVGICGRTWECGGTKKKMGQGKDSTVRWGDLREHQEGHDRNDGVQW